MATSPSSSQVVTSNNIEARDVNFNHTVHNHAGSPQRDPMQILQEHVAIGALHDSDERSLDTPKCHPQTRIAILDRIDQWATTEGKPILWLSGPAGAGKSAIAQTLVERWKNKGFDVVAFFFWRTASERNQKTRLVPTIALQLMELFPLVKPAIEAAISTIGFFKRSLSFQMEKLVVEPLRLISQVQNPVVIVIDGLDECCVDLPKEKDFPGQDYESQQRDILEALDSACSQLTWVRFLIVSRPERQIRESFGRASTKEQTYPLSMKDASDAEADIRLFLECKLEEIRQQHGIGAPWPTKIQLEELVRKSSGQFIYPSVAIKHIARARANPIQSLQAVLALQPDSVDKPLAELDVLYTLILKSVSTKSMPTVNDILGYFLPYRPFDGGCDLDGIFVSMIMDGSPEMFKKFLFLSEGEVNLHLTDLHSVLDIPSNPHNAIKLIHATFSEYLQDKSRSGNFFISKEHVSARYAHLCIRHLQRLEFSEEQSQSYIEDFLLITACSWIEICQPTRDLVLYLWSLMRAEIGRYPLATGYNTAGSVPLASKNLSSRAVSTIRKSRLSWFGELIGYLQKCNIPEVEPSWWRRFLVQWRLAVALKAHQRERKR